MENVIKTPAMLYRVEVDGHSWGTFIITDKGDLFINSDWGYWACCWRAFGGDFKQFLIGTNHHYLLSNLMRQQITHGGKKTINKRTEEAVAALFVRFQQELKKEISMEKFRIQVIDFLPQYGKFKTGIKDVDGVELCVGDTVERNNQKFLIAYRYGKFVLKPPLHGSYMTIGPDSGVKKLNQVTAVPNEFIIIGMDNEPFYQEVKHLIPNDGRN